MVTDVVIEALLEASLDYEEILRRLVHAVVPELADLCMIDMVDADGSLRKVAAAHADALRERQAQDLIQRGPAHADTRSWVASAVRTGTHRLISEVTRKDLRRGARDEAHVALLQGFGVCSVMIVPLTARGRTLGALNLFHDRSGRRFGEDDLAVAHDLAAHAALLVDSARLYANMRRSEHELRASHDELRVILDGIADGITVQDPDGHLVYANDVAARVLGFGSAQELMSTEPGEVAQAYEMFDEDGRRLGPDDLPGRAALRGEPAPERVIRSRSRSDPDEHWSITKARAVRDSAGRPVRAVNIFTDITALKRVERDREAALARAGADPLTGLANHRVFHERLASEVSRARRHGNPLALALIDVDHFKQINDTRGHQVGDRVLAEVSERLAEMARNEDVLARIGGDEFGLLLPHTDRLEAYAAIERARQAVSASDLVGVRVTVSAGICDLATAHDADSMFRFADGALYWSKAHGRDVAWIYDPSTIRELSAAERAEHLQQSQALVGLRALARAIDAKDPSTRQHSDRVAALAARLAGVLGWGFDRVALLSEAALVHDVGKIGVPDALLLKPGPLTAAEFEQVKLHALLSAQIVEDVLTAEQVAWIRCHHERPDGGGYPFGLAAEDIPLGAAVLTVADSWDVMTVSRPYSRRKTPEQALAECTSLLGQQFCAEAVEALHELHRRGLLETAAGIEGGGAALGGP